jgi:hypothetical protein
MNNELERIWKIVAAHFKILSQHLLEGLRKTTNHLSHDTRSPGQNIDPGPPEYEAGVPTTRP